MAYVNNGFRCMACGTIDQNDTLVNRPFTGWNSKGLIQVNNYCCPDCGSNDVIQVNIEKVKSMLAQKAMLAQKRG